MTGAAFYTVADDRYFLGAVGLINSLRLLGHTDPIHVLDCGLAKSQRELLAPSVTLVSAPSGTPPWLLKTVAPIEHEADVMVLLDADVVVTRPLTDLLESARHGVLAFKSRLDGFQPDWGRLLDIGAVERAPYICSALVVLGGSTGHDTLALWHDRQRRVDFELTHWRRNVPGYPFLYADQDVLNAILSSRTAAGRVERLPYRLAPMPPFEGVRVVDAATLRCAYEDGTEPYALHHCLGKPWLEPAYDGVYSRLLRRCLVGPDVEVRVPQEELPLRMRTGLIAAAERLRVNARESVRWNVLRPLADRVRSLRGSADGGAP
jgi:hypothetical protein